MVSFDGGWTAFAGAEAVIEMHAAAGLDIRDVAAEAERHTRVRAGADHHPLTWHGGIAFDPAASSGRDLPAVSFVLPSVEVRAHGGRATLAVNIVDGPGASRRRAAARAERRLEVALQRLAEALPPVRAPIAGRIRSQLPDRRAWMDSVEDAKTLIAAGVLEKVVLARTLDIEADGPLDAVAVLGELIGQGTLSHPFLFEPRPGVAMVGASPELLCRVNAGRFSATAVAGSAGRGHDALEDVDLANGLLLSEKDRSEHELVVRDMSERLVRLGATPTVEPDPHLLRLKRIWHLETRLAAELNGAGHVLEVLSALHPTPAVCGTPRSAARFAIAKLEPFDRGWYAGPIGWFDTDGNGAFVPALRCARVHGRSARLYAGAGIVAASDPAAEWEETNVKLRPVLEALGLEAGP